MAEQERHSLEVVRVERAKKKRDAPSYVEVNIDKTVHKTGHINADGKPTWNSTFTLSQLNTCGSFRVSWWQKRRILRFLYHRIGRVEVSVAELMQESDTNVQKLLNPESAGHVYLCFKKPSAPDPFHQARMHIESAEKCVERVKTLSDGAQYTMDAVGSVIDALNAIVEVIDEIVEMHALLKLSWKAITVLYKVVLHQFEKDRKLKEVVDKMKGAFSFIKQAKVVQDRTKEVKPQIKKLLDLAIECSQFVQEYASHEFFGRAGRVRAGQKIEEFTGRFAEMRRELDSAIGLNTAKGIDDIESRQLLQTLAERNEVSQRRRCLDGTRTEYLDMIRTRLLSKSGQNIIWLTGAAGSGKSTIAVTISDICDRERYPTPYLFFERGKDEYATVIQTIARKLATLHDKIRPHIVDATERDRNITGKPLKVQFEKLLLEPLQAAAPTLDDPVVIILDALDESGPREKRGELVQLLKTEFGKLPPMIRFLITSRPEDDIMKGLPSIDHIEQIELDHHSEDSKRDVSYYIREEMARAVDEEAPDNWTWDEITRVLADAAGGLFIWASTAVKMVCEPLDKVERLKELLDNVRSVGGGIDELYSTVLDQSGISWRENSKERDTFTRILGFILFAKEALSSGDIAAFYDLKETTVNAILGRLTSVVHYEPGQPVRLHHAFFADYLTERSIGKPWTVDEIAEKKAIAERCFDTMRRKLRFNIGDIPTSFARNADVPGIQDHINTNIPPDLDYACRFWSTHFCELPHPDRLLDRLRKFAYQDLLHWFEVLSLKECFTRVATSVVRDTAVKIASTDAELTSFLRGAYRLASVFSEPISRSVPHIYLSAISLWRGESRVADHYSNMHPVLRVHRLGSKMSAVCIRVLKVGSGVQSTAFSPDGKRLVSGSDDGMIRIWDVDSGELVAGPFTGHTHWIRSVAFSPDGHRVVSGCGDKTIRVWNVDNGELVAGPFTGHTHWVRSVAFSPDGDRVVSGSGDSTIRVWNAETGALLAGPFIGHTDEITSVAFSPDGNRVVSGSDDKTVRVWNADNGELVAGPFTGHTHWIRSVAISPDGNRVVSGSWDRTIRVWDADTGALLAGPFTGHTDEITSVAFSPVGNRVVSGSDDKTIRVWNADNGELVAGPFAGHTTLITSVAFSPDGNRIVSGSGDKTIRIWDAETSELDPGPFMGHTDWITSVAYSPVGDRIVSGSEDKTIRVWNADTGALVAGPFTGHTKQIISVAFSPDGSRLVSGSGDKTVRVWNADNGELVAGPFTGHADWIRSAAFSPGGNRVVSGSDDKTIRVWDADAGALVAGPFTGHTAWITSVAFSPDGNRVVSGSDDKMIRVWDANTGALVAGPFTGHTKRITSVAYSPDGDRIMSSSGDKTIRMWNAHNGELVAGPFTGHADWITSVAFSPDGNCVVSGSVDSTIRVWNADTGALIAGPFTGHTKRVTSVAYSPDGNRVVSGSDDETIRVWDVSNNEVSVENVGTSKRALSNWESCGDGWVRGAGGELLTWIPEDMRDTLLRARNTAVFSCQFSTQLDFVSSHLGAGWWKGFPRPSVPDSKVNGGSVDEYVARGTGE